MVALGRRALGHRQPARLRKLIDWQARQKTRDVGNQTLLEAVSVTWGDWETQVPEKSSPEKRLIHNLGRLSSSARIHCVTGREEASRLPGLNPNLVVFVSLPASVHHPTGPPC